MSERGVSVLDILALCCDKVSKVALLNCVKRAGVRLSDGEPIGLGELNVYFDELVDGGLVHGKVMVECPCEVGVPIIRGLAGGEDFLRLSGIIEKVLPAFEDGQVKTRARFVRQVTWCMARRDWGALVEYIPYFSVQFGGLAEREVFWVRLCRDMLVSDDELLGLPIGLQNEILPSVIWSRINGLEPVLSLIDPLVGVMKRGGVFGADLWDAVTDALLFTGGHEGLEWLLNGSDSCSLFREALFQFFGGNGGESKLLFAGACEWKRGRRPKSWFWVIYYLQLHGDGDSDGKVVMEGLWGDGADELPYGGVADILYAFGVANNLGRADLSVTRGLESFALWTRVWAERMLGGEVRLKYGVLERLERRLRDSEYLWLFQELFPCLVDGELVSVMKVFPPKPQWLNALQALSTIGAEPVVAEEREFRLIWVLHYGVGSYEFEPMVQQRRGSSWQRGPRVTLSKLKRDLPDYLSKQDMDILQFVDFFYVGPKNKMRWVLHVEKAIGTFVGHPFLFEYSNGELVPIEIDCGEPELFLRKGVDGYELTFSHDFSGVGEFLLKRARYHYSLITVKETDLAIKNVVGESLCVPLSAHDSLVQTVRGLAPLLTIHTDISFEDLPKVLQSRSKVSLQLAPNGDCLRVNAVVDVVGDGQRYLVPGRGAARVILLRNGKSVEFNRDLGAEKSGLNQLLGLCPTLELYHENYCEWLVCELDTILTIIEELRAVQDRFSVEWLAAEKWRLVGSASFDNLRLKVRREHKWFEVEGGCQVSASLRLEMGVLVDLISKNQGRFVQLKDGSFISIANRLRERVLESEPLFERDGERISVRPVFVVRCPILTDEDAEVEACEEWHALVARRREVDNKFFLVPGSFRATLRSYQEDGFNWLMRLCEMGFGACLADDMGLGKTVQCLAMLQQCANLGAALVVSPASLCENWFEEMGRFAPGLNPVLLHGCADREGVIGGAGRGDVVLISYGLLVSEEAMLVGREWQTVVLDEAQAIKNSASKRTRAAFGLRANFRVALTGTPVENHLHELWTIFNFLNPGLLGTKKGFFDRFIQAIIRHDDLGKRMLLRRLIGPFILRRCKASVLPELPAKTEISLSVRLGEQERALYEELRVKAVESLKKERFKRGHFNGGQNGGKAIQVLTSLMQLRRACCHPRLVLAESSYESSKLKRLRLLVEELMANGHKALVFSQFVGFLDEIRGMLNEMKVSYQYLDGSTPLKARQRRVKAFQEGEGDLFLISLKAGGTGLNLTAADYVIHMDPWWNPAVEDQASDRVHRIGQARPVTVYRLIAEDTIEEKVMRLHEEKRELAEKLLAGSDKVASLCVEDLIDLIST